jgi:hypothetical protein
VICGIASAAFGAQCERTWSGLPTFQDRGLEGLDPFGFLIAEEKTHILIKSGGHTTEYVFEQFDILAHVFVDGRPVDLNGVDTTSAKSDIASICGSDFQFITSIGYSAQQNPRSASAVQNLPAGQSNEDVAIADFNRDGATDSAVITGRGILVTLQRADGTKLSTVTYPVAGIRQSIVSADFNGDGVKDLAVTQGITPTAANPFPPGNVIVLLGKGDGTFGPPTAFPVGPVFNSHLASGDFSGDGFTDLAVTHSVAIGAGRVAVLLGKGDGSFGPAVDYPVGPSPFTLVAADFNGDGKLDLAALDAFGAANKVWVLLGRGNGTFPPAVSSVSGTREGFLAYADLNHDG